MGEGGREGKWGDVRLDLHVVRYSCVLPAWDLRVLPVYLKGIQSGPRTEHAPDSGLARPKDIQYSTGVTAFQHTLL